MRTRSTAALSVLIVAVAGSAIGYVVHDHVSAGPRFVTSSIPSPTPSVSRSPVLPTSQSTSPAASPAGIVDDLRRMLTDPALGPDFEAAVIDVTSGSTLFDRDGDKPQPPASTTKLMTASAALLDLGPGGRLTTRTVRRGHTVYLIGGGDVTLAAGAAAGYPQPASLAALARQTATAVAGGGAIRLRLDTSAWSGPARAPGWSAAYLSEGDITPPSALEVDEGRITPGDDAGPRVSDPAQQAGTTFAALLRQDHVRLVGRPSIATAPRDATPVAAVDSPTIAQLVQRMLTTSDNDLAEALGRTLARHDHLPADFAGEAAAVTTAVRSLGVTGIRLYDASGLSRRDRISPHDLVMILRADASTGHPQLRGVLEGLPISGFTGTLANRYRTPPAQLAAGTVRAKTGTLRGVSTLAGVLLDRSGQLLAFAFMSPHAAATAATEPALDNLASRLVRCGCA